MNDPVWFGNMIIARWEAFALLGMGALLAIILIVGIIAGAAIIFKAIFKAIFSANG